MPEQTDELVDALSVDGTPTNTVQTDREFVQATDRYRRELMAHCYRMLGSVHDAEDLLQETYLRAWRSYHGFEGRSSMRTWLYRIATNACLNALESKARRPLPTGLGNPSSDPADPLVESNEVPWLEPVPDSFFNGGDPASVITSRESVRLALIAALQHLPPKQRATLVLREVLQMPAAEVADVMETSVPAVNSSLQRARAQLDAAGLSEQDVVEPIGPQQRALLDSWVAALEAKNIPEIVKLFTADAVWEMPPFIGWYVGPEAIGTLIDTQCPAGPNEMKMLPVEANGQPGFALYILAGDQWQAFQLQVLTLSGGKIAHATVFFDLELFTTFGMPLTLPVTEPVIQPVIQPAEA
jgi:RNA polymerase sigma-70 factor (ECF subfamily)